MGKYNIGDKFVIEIRGLSTREGEYVYMGSERDTAFIDEKTLDQLDRLDYEYVNEHFGELQDEALTAGQNRWLEAGEIITTTKGRAVVMSADGDHYSVILLEAETADAEEKTVKDSSFILGRTGRKIDICNLLREAAGIQNKKMIGGSTGDNNKSK